MSLKSWFALGLFFLGPMTVSACNGSSRQVGGSTTGGTCPGPQACGAGAPCPQGSYCFSLDPCGDNPTCVPIPAECAATLTCACLVDAGAQNLGSNFECSGSGTGLYAYDNAGATECCP